MSDNKGKLNGICGNDECRGHRGLIATYINRRTKIHYCEACAYKGNKENAKVLGGPRGNKFVLPLYVLVRQTPLPLETKGKLNGRCNMSSCESNLPATYYNHGSREHYCVRCAILLNIDPCNKKDAMELFGHELCTEVK